MTARTSFRRLSAAARVALAAALFGVGCAQEQDDIGADATVRGRVSDGDGSQFTRLGGTGSVDAAASVAAYAFADDGSLEALGSGSVEADGSFEFDVESGHDRVIVSALSAGGDVVASAILESTGEAGDTVTCTPLDTESSLEAEVLVAMVAQAGSAEATNPVDVRLRLDGDTAVEVRATFEDQGEAEGEAAIDALAEAMLAAQATALAAWADNGFETTQDAMFSLQVEASQELSQDLYAGGSADAAWADFTASLQASFESASGLSEGEEAECEAQAGLAFRLVVNERLEGSDTAWEATQAAAMLEAEAEASAVAALFAAAGAGQVVIGECEQAGNDLAAAIEASASMSALASAWADYEAALIGETTVEGSVLGDWLEVNTATAVLVDGALDTCAQSAGTLEQGVTSQVHILLAGLGGLDTVAVASAVVDAWATHRATVEATIANADPAIPSEDAEVAADVAILATAGFTAAD